MANNIPQNHSHAPDFRGGVFGITVEAFVDANSPLVGKSIINGLWSKISTSSQMRHGNYLMDRSRDLLGRYLQLIEDHQQDVIWDSIDESVRPPMSQSVR